MTTLTLLASYHFLDMVFDSQGCRVESFRILAPGDAWAANNGYRSAADMKSILLHRVYGEVGRHTVNPALLDKDR
jgi:hypothetical protein